MKKLKGSSDMLCVSEKLGQARWRLTFQQFLHDAAWALLAGFWLCFIFGGVTLIRPVLRGLFPLVGALGILVPLAVALGAAFFRWRSLRVVAEKMDACAPTKNRFLTAMNLDKRQPVPFVESIHSEVTDWVSRFNPRDYLRFSFPGRTLLWLLVPLAGLAALESFRQWRTVQRAPELAAARQMIERVEEAGARLADENGKLAQALQEMEDTRNELANSAEPMRDALRAMADLEQKLTAPANAQTALSAGEIAALADALAARHPELAANLRSGNHPAAAATLEKLDAAALDKALEQAARHRENSRLRELSRQKGTARALATMLQMAGAEATRRKFLTALNDIKTGSALAAAESPGRGDAPPNNAPAGAEKSSPAQGENAPPGGSPGSQKDLASGSNLTNDGEVDAGQAGPGFDDSLHGKQGDGASLVEMFRADGNDGARTQQAYRSAYHAALPAALDAVNREQIPAGSRLLVRRYFEAIRPRE